MKEREVCSGASRFRESLLDKGKERRTRSGEVGRNNAGEEHAEIKDRLLPFSGSLLDVHEQIGRDGSNDGQRALISLPPVYIALCTSGIGLSGTTLEGGPEGGESGRLKGVDKGL